MKRNYNQTIKAEYEAIFSDLITFLVQHAQLIKDPYIRLSFLKKTNFLHNEYGSDMVIYFVLGNTYQDIAESTKDFRFAYQVCLKSKLMFENSLETPNQDLKNAVLERLNSVLEPSRALYLAEMVIYYDHDYSYI